jgi:caffeoyl-CoA O-methyltransferase
MAKIFQPITEQLNQYITDCSLRESPEQAKLRRLTDERVAAHSHLAITPTQAQFLGFMVSLIGAKKAIEVGVFTGYGTLSIAQALPEDGCIVACDVSAEYAELGKPIWEEARVLQKIDLRIGRAAETLQGLLDGGEAESFDLVFIDADKQNYRNYYELALKLLRSGGLLIWIMSF